MPSMVSEHTIVWAELVDIVLSQVLELYVRHWRLHSLLQ